MEKNKRKSSNDRESKFSISDSDYPKRGEISPNLYLVRQPIIHEEFDERPDFNEEGIFEERKNLEEEEGQINFRRVSDQNRNLFPDRLNAERVNLISNL